MNRKRITTLGGLALGCGLLALAPAIAGADDPVLPDPSGDTPVDTSPADFVASASGGQEVPGNASPAFAAAEFRLGEDGTTLNYAARVFGLADPTVAHLHLGPLGVSGPIVVTLQPPGQPGTSGCAAVVGGGVTTLGGASADDHRPGGDGDGSSTTDPDPGGSGDEACAAIVPDGSTTSTSGGTSTTHPGDGEHTTSTTAAGTSTSAPTSSTAAPQPVGFRSEDDACRTLLVPHVVPPSTSTSTSGATSSTSSTTSAPTSSTSGSSTSTSGGTTSTTMGGSTTSASEPGGQSSQVTYEPPTTEAPPSTPDGLCGFADVSGVITASDLSGPLAGTTLPDLLAAIRAGTIYVNFHTTAFPAGEIRGQLIPQNPLLPTTTTTTAPTSTSTTAATTSTTAPTSTSSTSTTAPTSTTEAPVTTTTAPTTTTTGGSTTTTSEESTTTTAPTTSTTTASSGE